MIRISIFITAGFININNNIINNNIIIYVVFSNMKNFIIKYENLILWENINIVKYQDINDKYNKHFYSVSAIAIIHTSIVNIIFLNSLTYYLYSDNN